MPNAVNITYAVYVDFAYTGSGSPDFTQPLDNITQWVKGLSCTLGITRPDENVAYTGTCTLTLNNADRRFSPLYSSGAYYGNLVGGKPVKVTVTQSGSTYTIWTGYTRQIKVTAGQYKSREATIECVDIMARLQDEMIAIPLQENVTASTLLKHVVNTAMKSAVATGTLTIAAGNAADGDTVTINGTAYTFKTSLSGAANQVLIGSANTDTCNNLAAAINLADGAGTTYGSVTTRIGIVTASVASNIVTFTAAIRGAVGNYALAKSGANLTLSGAAMTGGVDYTPSSYEAGDETFTIAADKWNSNDTNGISAIQDVIDSEQGLFWVARDGTVTFKARNYLFKQPTTASSLTLNSEQTDFDATMDQEQIYNRVEVEVRPRSQLSVGTVAESKATIVAPGQSGTARWNGTVVLPGGGSTTVKLPFTDPTTGRQCGARDLIVPLVPYTDFTASDYETGGFDYTSAVGVNFAFSYAINGSNIEITIVNTALGPLYFTTLKVRGTAIVDYDPQNITVEDATSQDAYGKRVMSVKLPLPSTVNYAQSLAEYKLSRFKNPAFRINSISFGGQNLIGAVKLYALEIGNNITITDYQSAVSGAKYMITGISYNNIAPRTPGEITFYLRAIEDTTYWILEDSTYGKLDVTTRPGV